MRSSGGRRLSQTRDGNQKGERREALPADDQHAVYGREPVRVDRHQPVERRERDRHAIRDKAAAAQDLHPARDARIAGAVLLERPGVEEIRQAVPDQKIDSRPGPERTSCSGRSACAAAARRSRPVPGASSCRDAHAEGNRQKEQGHHRQHPRRRADRPADDDAPRAARQLMHHAEREAAQRDAEAPHVRQQVRLQKLRDVDERARRATPARRWRPRPAASAEAARARGSRFRAFSPSVRH